MATTKPPLCMKFYLDRLKELGVPAPIMGDETSEEIDRLAKRLTNEGVL